MEATKHYVQSFDGTSLFYQTYGEGEPLLLLHGNGGSSRYFKEQISTFSRYFKVIAMDSREHGKSGNQKNYLSFKLMARDILAICQREGLSRVNLLGFSDGANLAMTFAVLYPQHVDRLVLNSGNLEPADLTWWTRMLSQVGYWLTSMVSGISSLAAHFARLLSLIVRPLEITTADLSRLNRPTLVIVGQRDSIKLRHTAAIAKALPQSELEIVPKVGHTLAKKRPEVFNQRVLRFLMEPFTR